MFFLFRFSGDNFSDLRSPDIQAPLGKARCPGKPPKLEPKV
jgi:hypothetical protein